VPKPKNGVERVVYLNKNSLLGLKKAALALSW
jgi:hypothetical protein